MSRKKMELVDIKYNTKAVYVKNPPKIKHVNIINISGFSQFVDDVFILIEWDEDVNFDGKANLKDLVQVVNVNGYDGLEDGSYFFINLDRVGVKDTEAEALSGDNALNDSGYQIKKISGLNGVENSLYYCIPFIKNHSEQRSPPTANLDLLTSSSVVHPEKPFNRMGDNLKIFKIENLPDVPNGFYLGLFLDEKKTSQFYNTDTCDHHELGSSPMCVTIFNIKGVENDKYILLRLKDKENDSPGATGDSIGPDMENEVIESEVVDSEEEESDPHPGQLANNPTLTLGEFLKIFRTLKRPEGYTFQQIKSELVHRNFSLTHKKLSCLLFRAVQKHKIFKVTGGQSIRYKPKFFSNQ